MNLIREKRRVNKGDKKVSPTSSRAPNAEIGSNESDLIGRTTDLWQPYAARPLTREDGRQIVENMTGFFSVLQEWRRAETDQSKKEK